MMSEVADCMPPRFILSTGDNFYSHGLRSGKDSQVAKSFSNVYDSRQLQEVRVCASVWCERVCVCVMWVCVWCASAQDGESGTRRCHAPS
jgi:hypothetical protein